MNNASTEIAKTQQHRSARTDIVFAFALAIALYVAWMVHEVLLIV